MQILRLELRAFVGRNALVITSLGKDWQYRILKKSKDQASNPCTVSFEYAFCRLLKDSMMGFRIY